MTKEEAYKTIKENLCAMCAYGSQNMESCDIRSCDNRDAIKALEQESKTGRWIFVHPLQENDGGAYMCSNCKTGDWSYQSDYNFCPNCGAKMIEPQESEGRRWE